MTTFTSLTDRVSQELIDVPQRTEDQLATFVNQAIRKLQFRHDFAVCKTTTGVLTTTAATNTLAAVPSDFLRFQKVAPYVISKEGYAHRLGVAGAWEDAQREFGTTDGGDADADTLTGPPKSIAIGPPSDVENTRNFLIYPLSDGLSRYTTAPAGEYRIRIPYIRQLPDLSGSQENWFTKNAEEFIVYLAISIGFFFNHDEQRGRIWFDRAGLEARDVLIRDKMEGVRPNNTLNISMDALGPSTPFGDGGMYRGYF